MYVARDIGKKPVQRSLPCCWRRRRKLIRWRSRIAGREGKGGVSGEEDKAEEQEDKKPEEPCYWKRRQRRSERGGR
jgi:hypothetical protein